MPLPASLARRAAARELGSQPRPPSAAGYLVYCVGCLVVAGALLVVAVWEDCAPRTEVRFWRRRLRPWEEAAEAFVGAALCTETFTSLKTMGCRIVLRSRWRFLDAVVASLTVVCGIFFVLRRVLQRAEDVVEEIDVPMLALRFALQPIRMISTASMVVRAHRKRRAARETPKPLPVLDPRLPCAELKQSALSPALAAQIRDMLPAHLRFSSWQLAYAPGVHGTSLNTFYRQQAGPNVVVVQDAQGGLFGGFAAEPWRPHAGAYGGAGEAFVFAAREASEMSGMGVAVARDTLLASGSNVPCSDSYTAAGEVELVPRLTPTVPMEPQLDVYWAVPKRDRIIQWSDSKMMGLGRAVVVWDNFLRGSSGACDAFGSSPLSSPEFVIRSFECWHVGGIDEC